MFTSILFHAGTPVNTSPGDQAVLSELDVRLRANCEESDHCYNKRDPTDPDAGVQPPDDSAEKCSPAAGGRNPGVRWPHRRRRPHHHTTEDSKSAAAVSHGLEAEADDEHPALKAGK